MRKVGYGYDYDKGIGGWGLGIRNNPEIWRFKGMGGRIG